MQQRLVVVECKHWTSAGTGGRTVPQNDKERADFARQEWQKLLDDSRAGFGIAEWNDTNKIALPLRPPLGHESGQARQARRILAIWYPKSQDGESYWSRLPANVALPPGAVDVPIEVFSASMYLRELHAQGHRELPTSSPDTERALVALDSIIIRNET